MNQPPPVSGAQHRPRRALQIACVYSKVKTVVTVQLMTQSLSQLHTLPAGLSLLFV